jgi:hypothetical protein
LHVSSLVAAVLCVHNLSTQNDPPSHQQGFELPINELQLFEPGYEEHGEVAEIQPVPIVKQVDIKDLHSASDVAVVLSLHTKSLQLLTTPVF